MHNLICKIKKAQVLPTLKHKTPTTQESQKVELEILIGQDFVVKHSSIPFLPSLVLKNSSIFSLLSTSKNGQRNHIPNARNPIIFRSSHHIF